MMLPVIWKALMLTWRHWYDRPSYTMKSGINDGLYQYRYSKTLLTSNIFINPTIANKGFK